MRVGIFGGTFNPPHKTHVSLAREAKKQLDLDRLIVIPCGFPPHKPCDVDAETRLKLSQLAFGDFAEVSDLEIQKQGKSYTVETLRIIKRRFPDAELFLIIGGDSFAAFESWYCPKEIASLATLAVAARDHKTLQRTANKITQNTGAKAVFLDVRPNSVSSTEVRLRYEFGLDNAEFVPAAVDKYVLQNDLYAKHKAMAQKLRGYLKDERLNHTFYVVKRGLELAAEEEKEKVFVACLLHDCAKYVDESRYAEYGFEKPDDMPKPVVHSFLGAYVAKKDFGITDQEVLDAIAFHTTGCPNMTRLQKIVYVADKTEQTRKYPISHLTKGSLETRFRKCLWEASTCHEENQLYPLTKQTLDFYFPNR